MSILYLKCYRRTQKMSRNWDPTKWKKFKEFFHYMLNETDGKKFEGTYDDSFYLNGLLWALQVFWTQFCKFEIVISLHHVFNWIWKCYTMLFINSFQSWCFGNVRFLHMIIPYPFNNVQYLVKIFFATRIFEINRC